MNMLEGLGYNDWFISRVDGDMSAAHKLARVISVHKDSFIVTTGGRGVFAELSGRLLHSADSSLALPTTGDWVYADFYDDDSHGIIHGVLPRRTLLKRKSAGKLVDFQLIAANIDTAFIVQSADFNFNIRRLERYLVMVKEGDITPVILLSKCDLISSVEIDEITMRVLSIAPEATVLSFSNLNGENIDKIKALLLCGRTYCLIGSSGVGKTSLLNSILGDDTFEVQSVSKKESKGRHTTTSRELIQLQCGALLIDTPGMRELGNISVDSGLDETFSEVLALIQSCKFSDCSHTNEKGCAILAALESGELEKQRYKSYIKIKKESEFHDMSYSEKRKKDKTFGKMIKTVIKGRKRR